MQLKKIVDDDQVDCKMKKWPQKAKRCPDEDFYFIPIYIMYKNTKILS